MQQNTETQTPTPEQTSAVPEVSAAPEVSEEQASEVSALRVGHMFVRASLTLAVGTAIIGMLSRVEHYLATDTDRDFSVFGGLNQWFRMWTTHKMAFILLVAMPLLIGTAIMHLPRQIGSRTIAFPHAATAAFWLWLLGACMTLASVFAGGGWAALDSGAALDGSTASTFNSIALTLLGTSTTIVALLICSVVVLTTVISLRRPGISLLDTPPFMWSMFVSSTVWLLTYPIAIANLILIYIDIRGRPPIAFGQPTGMNIWYQVDWITEQPAIYALAIPVLGIALEMTTKKMALMTPLAKIAIASFGLLSVGGWIQDFLLTTDFNLTTTAAQSTSVTEVSDPRYGLLPVAFAFLAVISVAVLNGVLLKNWLTSSGLRFSAGLKPVGATAGFLIATAGFFMLTLATILGALRVRETLDLLDSKTNSAMFALVVFAVIISASVYIRQHFATEQPKATLGASTQHSQRGFTQNASPQNGFTRHKFTQIPSKFAESSHTFIIAILMTFIGGMLIAGADFVAGLQGDSNIPSAIVQHALLLNPNTAETHFVIDTNLDYASTLHIAPVAGAALAVLGIATLAACIMHTVHRSMSRA